MPPKCCVGRFLKLKGNSFHVCRRKGYRQGLEAVAKLSVEDQINLGPRVGTNTLKKICAYHKKVFINEFTSTFGAWCCDPLKLHPLLNNSKSKNSNRRRRAHGIAVLKIDHRIIGRRRGVDLIPGKSLCKQCYEVIILGKWKNKLVAKKRKRRNGGSIKIKESKEKKEQPEEEPDFTVKLLKVREAISRIKIDDLN